MGGIPGPGREDTAVAGNSQQVTVVYASQVAPVYLRYDLTWERGCMSIMSSRGKKMEEGGKKHSSQ
jgi:hypothetical protein